MEGETPDLAVSHPYDAACDLSSRLKDMRAANNNNSTVATFVPVYADKKQPLVRHAHGEWTAEVSERWLQRHRRGGFRIGMWLYELFVLDFDEHELYAAWVDEHPEIGVAPAERTRRGVRVFFQRCAAVVKAGLTDGPLVHPDTGAKANIDRKTITSKGSGGLLVCSPTPNYSWISGRSLLKLDVSPMTPGLLEKVIAYSTRSAPKPRGRPKKRPLALAADDVARDGKTSKNDVVGGGGDSLVQVAPEAQFRELLALFVEFPVGAYVDGGGNPSLWQTMRTSLGQLSKYRTVEEFRARATNYTCHMCGGKHTDTIQGTFKTDPTTHSYVLTVRHFRAKANPACHAEHRIDPTSAAAYVQRFMERPRLSEVDASAVILACTSAGVHIRDNAAAVWHLDVPAPGFEAYALLYDEDKEWRTILVPTSSEWGIWLRTTKYPGLFYDFLDHRAWRAYVADPSLSSSVIESPPFWTKATSST